MSASEPQHPAPRLRLAVAYVAQSLLLMLLVYGAYLGGGWGVLAILWVALVGFICTKEAARVR